MTQTMGMEILSMFAANWAELAWQAAIKGTAVLTAAFLAAWTLRRSSAALRHLVWAGALCGMVALPFLSIGLPSWEAAVLPAPKASSTEHAPANGSTPPPGSLAAVTSSSARNAEARADSVAAGLAWAASAEPEQALAAQTRLAPGNRRAGRRQETQPVVWAFAFWLAGFSAILLRYLLGVLKVGQILEHSRPAEAGVALTWLRTYQARLGFRRPVRLWVSSSATAPFAWGCRRSVIVVPSGFSQWPVTRRRDVLLHEMAHVRRADVVW